MRRDEYDALIEELRAKQRKIWESALEDFLRWRSCPLGLCAVLDDAEYAARTAEGGDAREKSAQYVGRVKAQNERPWIQAARAVEHLQISIVTLARERDALV